MLDDDQSNPSTADDLPRPPRGRRSSRRPAGPPAPVTEVPTIPVVAAEPEEEAAEVAAGMPLESPDPTPAEADLAPAEEPAAAVEPEETPQPPRPRRRATRKQAAPEPVAEVPARTVADAAEPQTRAAAEAAPEAAAEAAPAEEPPAKPARRRRAATRPQAAPEPVEEVPARTLAEAPSEQAAEVAAEMPLEAPAAEPATEALAEAPAEAEAEPEKPARRSRRRVASPFAPPTVLSPVETEAALAELASAIAGAPADEPATETAEPGSDADVATIAEAVAEGTESEQTEDTEAQADADADEENEDGTPRRRRRRRGGRRRRRGAESDAADESDEDDEKDDETDDAEGPDEGDESTEAGDGTRRRRRRRRRRGEDTTGEDDGDAEVVVRVREPRRAKASDEVTGIDGSTRLEAKRQRRREGRAAGRRRTPILSEAEFLSRRESVDRTMAIRQSDDYTEIAVLEDNVLVEHYVDRKSSTSLIGNIYLGRVQNVLPSMEAAFIDIGRGRNAVLYAGEVNWDAYLANGEPRKMEVAFKSGQSVLVQVTKDPVGAKGARLTSHISIPGRYIVYSPSGELSGISRKLPDVERQRLKALLETLVPDEAGVIVRTAAEGVEEAELTRDVNRLTAQWDAIQKKVKAGSAPALLYAEPDATVRIVRDLFTEDFKRLVVAGNGSPEDAYETIEGYVTHVAPHLADRLERWDESKGDVFADYRVDEQIAKALERKVFLPSGGSLIIDRTEAMTVIDVNTGKFTGTGGNLEATVTSNNLEAAEEIVRQLRLRDIGGIIVIDFIDMVLPANRELLLRRLVECLGRDRTRHQVSEVTSLGLVQMTRKKIGTGLAEAFTVECETCKGRGYHVHDRPVASQHQADGGDRAERRARRGGGKAKPEKADKQDKPKKEPRGKKAAKATEPVAGTASDGEQPAEA